jgi:4-hydroxybenzoate polyprenyltransferase
VPGDPLAGYLLASGPNLLLNARPLLAAAAGLFFYAAGLILNDVADLPTDRRERPGRPLPSGRIPPRRAGLSAAALLCAGALCVLFLGRPAWWFGASLIASVMVYDFLAKRNAVAGPILMGLCRGLNLLLGAAAAWPVRFWPPPAWFGAAALALYVLLVSRLARDETAVPGRPRLIGLLLGLLLPLQAAFTFCSGTGRAGAIAGAALLALWPLNRLWSRRFSAS